MGNLSKLWGAGLGSLVGNIVGLLISTLTTVGGPNLSGSRVEITTWVTTILGAMIATYVFPANKL